MTVTEILKNVTGYQMFVMVRLANLYGIIDDRLEYDTQWQRGESLYIQFANSKFNDPKKPEYECIEAYLYDIITNFADSALQDKYMLIQTIEVLLNKKGGEVSFENLDLKDRPKSHSHSKTDYCFTTIESIMSNLLTLAFYYNGVKVDSVRNDSKEYRDTDVYTLQEIYHALKK